MSDVTKITSGSLIAAEKVNGTDVYNMNGDHLGSVEDIMLDKVSGKAIYAVMSFGGFLGIGEKQHPLPWSALTYNRDLGGYELDLTDEQIRNAPKIDDAATWDWSNADSGRRLAEYYGTTIIVFG